MVPTLGFIIELKVAVVTAVFSESRSTFTSRFYWWEEKQRLDRDEFPYVQDRFFLKWIFHINVLFAFLLMFFQV